MIRKLKSGKNRLVLTKEESENGKTPEFGNLQDKGGSSKTRAGGPVL